MIPTSDPDILIERMTWFDTAFRGVCKPAAERLRTELEAHYDHVFQQTRGADGSELEAHRAGIAALGDPHAARKRFRAKYLTERQYRSLESDGAFLSPRYSREMDTAWGLCVYLSLVWAASALDSSGLFYAGGYALAAVLVIPLAAIIFSLRGKAPRGEYSWALSLLFVALGLYGFYIQSRMAIRNWPRASLWGTPDALDWLTLGLQLLCVAVFSLGVCLHMWRIQKARNSGLIGPKRSKGVQPN